MNAKHPIVVALLVALGLGVLVTSSAAARAADDEWDSSYDLEHVDDEIAGHETATDLHLKYTLDDGESVTEATADGADATITHTDEGTLPNTTRTATLEWDFSPGIARGSKVKIKIKAGGSTLSLGQAWWTYGEDRGGSLLSVGPDLDLDTCELLLSNNSEEAIDGTVAFATRSFPIPLASLNFGNVPGFLPAEPISLVVGESVILVPPACDQVLLMELSITGADSLLQQNTIYQHTANPGIPALSNWGLAALTLLLIGAGTIVMRRARRPAIT